MQIPVNVLFRFLKQRFCDLSHSYTSDLQKLTMLTSILSECSPRLIALGGTCPDHSDAIYANTVPSKYSKSALINHGVWVTKKAIEAQREKAAEAEEQRAHFS